MKWPWIFLLLLVLAPFVHADEPSKVKVDINETGKVTSYLNSYWIVNVEGTGSVRNPSDTELFDVRLFFDSLGLTVIPGDGENYFQDGHLLFPVIGPGETVTFSYRMIGVAAQPPTLSNRGVLYSALAKESPRIYSDVFGELHKAPLEDPDYTGRDARLISITLENPSSLQYTIDSLRVIKTPELDPNEILDEWRIVNESSPKILASDGFYVHDFLDYDASEGEVYWLQTDIFVGNLVLTGNSNLTRLSEQDLDELLEELNFTNQSVNSTATQISSEYLLRKSVSNTLAVPGQPVTLRLQLYNFQPSLARFSLNDSLPTGFSASETLSWQGEIPARNSVVIEYSAVLEDTALAGIDRYPSATASVEGSTVRSNAVPFVRQYSSQQNVYVQKRVSYLSEDLSSVSISVRNLGENPLSNVTLKEFLSDEAEFSQLSQQPLSKGVWSIDFLSEGEAWQVEYVTDSSESVRTLPAVYGVPSEQVLRTLVLENVVNEAWNFVRTRGVEIIGFAALLGLPLLLVLSKNFGWFTRP